jgi:hypothetical protein
MGFMAGLHSGWDHESYDLVMPHHLPMLSLYTYSPKAEIDRKP